MHSRKRVQL
nr:unnamed protein product [Callosobruchus analis]